MTKIEFRDVYVPVKCQADVPQRPQYGGDAVNGVVDLLEYCEQLEAIVKACVEPKTK